VIGGLIGALVNQRTTTVFATVVVVVDRLAERLPDHAAVPRSPTAGIA
jgi:hypothetical protein